MNSSEPIPTNKELQAVKDVIASFLVSLKNFGLYPENHAICQKCLTNVFDRLGAFLNTYDSMRLDLEKERLLYQSEIVFQESAGEENLAFFLYRDGIRWVEFKKGLKSKEIRGFLNILNCYRTVQEDPEGDLVTALWEAHFPNIRYKASDIYWDSEPLLELNLLSMGEAKSFGENVSEEEQENSLSTTLRSSEKGLFKLNADEIAKLREMIIEEENRDIVKDLLDLASVLLKDQGNKKDLEAFLQFIKNEIKVALTQENFQLAHKTLNGLHKMRLASKTENPWAISIFNNVIKSISDPNILSKILPILEKAELNRFKLIRQFLVLLHSNAILTLGPMLSQIRSISVQQQLLEIIEIMARRDLQPLEQLLSSNDEYVVRSLVYIAGRIPGKKANQILLKMIHNPSERVRKQAIKHLIAKESVSLEIIFPFIEDSSKSIRQLILDYLKQNKPEKGEALLIDYLQQKRFLLNNHQHIIACYKTLGKCGSSKSIPFLQKLLFKRRWLPDFRGSIHQQGSVIALIGLETKEARRLLQKASRSFFPNVRIVYRRGLEAIH
jgi:HEAT repeat protein